MKAALFVALILVAEAIPPPEESLMEYGDYDDDCANDDEGECVWGVQGEDEEDVGFEDYADVDTSAFLEHVRPGCEFLAEDLPEHILKGEHALPPRSPFTKDFHVVPPTYSLYFSDECYAAIFISMLLGGMTMGELAYQRREGGILGGRAERHSLQMLRRGKRLARVAANKFVWVQAVTPAIGETS